MLFVPTMSGVGDRAELGTPTTSLDTHIQDVLAVIDAENLTDITLIGHSYGGFVATGVADRARDRILRLIYLDAFVPENGKSLYELLGRPVDPNADWRVPPRPIPPDTSEADARWIAEKRTAQPLGCFTAKLIVGNEAALPPRSYIRCTRVAPDDPMRTSMQRARQSGWIYREIDASHSPHITAPDLLATTIMDIVSTDIR